MVGSDYFHFHTNFELQAKFGEDDRRGERKNKSELLINKIKIIGLSLKGHKKVSRNTRNRTVMYLISTKDSKNHHSNPIDSKKARFSKKMSVKHTYKVTLASSHGDMGHMSISDEGLIS